MSISKKSSNFAPNWRRSKTEAEYKETMNTENAANRGEIIIYRAEDNTVQLDVRMEQETVWLTQKQIAELFGVKRPAITKHLRNIFNEGELDQNSVSSILEHTAVDGKIYSTQFYNLDAILSVGYRVNSKRAVAFRQWANRVLKDFLIKGYAVNDKIRREQLADLRQLVQIVGKTA